MSDLEKCKLESVKFYNIYNIFLHKLNQQFFGYE